MYDFEYFETRYCNKCNTYTKHKHTRTTTVYTCMKHGTEDCVFVECKRNFYHENMSAWRADTVKKFACVLCMEASIRRMKDRLERIKQMKCKTCGKHDTEYRALNHDESELICGDCFICNLCKSRIDLSEESGYVSYERYSVCALAHIKCYNEKIGPWKWTGSAGLPPPAFISTQSKFKSQEDAMIAVATATNTKF